jgi:hypothetical protein
MRLIFAESVVLGILWISILLGSGASSILAPPAILMILPALNCASQREDIRSHTCLADGQREIFFIGRSVGIGKRPRMVGENDKRGESTLAEEKCSQETRGALFI